MAACTSHHITWPSTSPPPPPPPWQRARDLVSPCLELCALVVVALSQLLVAEKSGKGVREEWRGMSCDGAVVVVVRRPVKALLAAHLQHLFGRGAQHRVAHTTRENESQAAKRPKSNHYRTHKLHMRPLDRDEALRITIASSPIHKKTITTTLHHHLRPHLLLQFSVLGLPTPAFSLWREGGVE